MRVILLSEPLPAISVLDRVARASGHEPVALIKPRARERQQTQREYQKTVVDQAPPQLAVCLVTSPAEIAPLLRAFEADLALCLGYPWKLPPEALAAARLGVVNAHPSLLPRHRGPNPLAWQLIEGDEEVGMTLHFMDDGFDTGPVLAQAARPMPAEVWSMADVAPLYVELVEELLPETLDRVAAGDRGTPQNGAGSDAPLLGEVQSSLDPALTAAAAHRLVQAWAASQFHVGERGPFLELDGVRRRIARTSLTERAGARRVDCADAPLWIVESEPV